MASQSAWQAAFGLEPWLDPDIGTEAPFVKKEGDKKKVDQIPVSVPLLFYLLLIVPLTVVSLLAVVLTAFPNLAPPAVRLVVPWRWLITAGLTLLTLLLLGLQMLVGFGLESKVAEIAEKRIHSDVQAAKDEPTRKTLLLRQAEEVGGLRRSFIPGLVLVLHIIALLSCVVVWWLDSRPTQPLPRIDGLW